MRSPFIKVASVSLEVQLANVLENVRRIEESFENTDAKIVVYPELCLTGYTCADLFHQEELIQSVLDGLMELKKVSTRHPHRLMVVGAPLQREFHLYNCAVFLLNGEIKWVLPKIYLPNYNEFYEARWFESGSQAKPGFLELDHDYVPFGTGFLLIDQDLIIGGEICEDLWVPNRPSNDQVLAGANVIVNLSASNELIGKESYRRQLVLQQSAVGNCAYLYASCGLGESSTDLVFSGHCLIAQNGHLLKESIWPVSTQITEAILDLDQIQANRRRQGTFQTNDAFSEIQIDLDLSEKNLDQELSFLSKNHYTVDPFPFVPRGQEERLERSKRILAIQSRGLYQRLKATGIRTAVIGVSGGLDSTLALLVLHETRKLLPNLRILGITMPSVGNTTDYTYQNALKLMRVLQVDSREIPIQEMVKDHLEKIGHPGYYQGEGDTTYENAQARMRTYLLMDIANKEAGLVIGTGDLSELALGWCTYNGDHMSMYGVNGSIPKTLVKYICESYALQADQSELREVLLRIVDTPISPELTPNKNGQIAQKTEEKIGKYDLNDFFLYHFLRFDSRVKKLVVLASLAYPSLSREEIKVSLMRFLKRFFSQQFKRSCLPDGPKVGTITLSPRGDWRMPSDASVHLWLEELERI